MSGFLLSVLGAAIGDGKLKAKIVNERRGFTIKRADPDAFVRKL